MQHCKTRVVDAPMAAGKTTKLIKWIKEVHSYHPVIVLVERNSEVDRLKEALGDLFLSTILSTDPLQFLKNRELAWARAL